MIIEQVLHQATQSVLNIIKNVPETSIMFHMMDNSNVQEMFESKHVRKVCFTDHKCVDITSKLGKTFEKNQFQHFSIIVPTNQMFRLTDRKTTVCRVYRGPTLILRLSGLFHHVLSVLVGYFSETQWTNVVRLFIFMSSLLLLENN